MNNRIENMKPVKNRISSPEEEEPLVCGLTWDDDNPYDDPARLRTAFYYEFREFIEPDEEQS